MNQIVESIGSFIMIIAVFMIFAQIIKSTYNFILKRRMMELGHIDAASIEFLSKPGESKLQNIKWGLLCFFGGLGLVVIQFLPYKDEQSPLPYGIEAIFLSIGFFLYYIFARRQE